MRNRRMKIKRIRNITLLTMIILVITGIYINIRKSRAEEANGILVKITDIEGKISEQRISLIATENEDRTYNVKIPNVINTDKIVSIYDQEGGLLNFESTENGINLTLTKEEIAENFPFQEYYKDAKNIVSKMTILSLLLLFLYFHILTNLF